MAPDFSSDLSCEQCQDSLPWYVADALSDPHARESRMGERVMKGWILVAPPGLEDGLSAWVARGVAYARGLPPK